MLVNQPSDQCRLNQKCGYQNLFFVLLPHAWRSKSYLAPSGKIALPDMPPLKLTPIEYWLGKLTHRNWVRNNAAAVKNPDGESGHLLTVGNIVENEAAYRAESDQRFHIDHNGSVYRLGNDS